MEKIMIIDSLLVCYGSQMRISFLLSHTHLTLNFKSVNLLFSCCFHSARNHKILKAGKIEPDFTKSAQPVYSNVNYFKRTVPTVVYYDTISAIHFFLETI